MFYKIAVTPYTSVPGVYKAPIEKGLVTDWDMLEKVYKHTWYQIMRLAPEEKPCLYIETPQAPKAQREKITQIAFES